MVPEHSADENGISLHYVFESGFLGFVLRDIEIGVVGD
ncbi:MAG: hypothetical protein RIR97_459 [Pseudomonadota bacterium]